MRWGNSGLRSGHALIRIKQLEKGKVINLGVLKTTIINQIVIAACFMGVSPVRIALWYQNKRRVDYDYNKN